MGQTLGLKKAALLISSSQHNLDLAHSGMASVYHRESTSMNYARDFFSSLLDSLDLRHRLMIGCPVLPPVHETADHTKCSQMKAEEPEI
jgi:hypothetical protein